MRKLTPNHGINVFPSNGILWANESGFNPHSFKQGQLSPWKQSPTPSAFNMHDMWRFYNTTAQKSGGISKLCASWIHSLEPRIMRLELCFQPVLSILQLKRQMQPENPINFPVFYFIKILFLLIKISNIILDLRPRN